MAPSSRAATGTGLSDRLYIYWPLVFAVSTMGLILLLDSKTANAWPPTVDLSGKQALKIASSPWFFGPVLALVAGILGVNSFARKAGLPAEEHASMVWWLCNLVWFHTACDLLSGFWQVMPGLTELYAHMSPAHLEPRWHESRAHLDSGYALEALVEVPLAAWVLWLFLRRDPARYMAEVFAVSVQMAGTVTYYIPGLAKGEAACWLSWADRSCGAVWIIFPVLLFRRHLAAARLPRAGKTQ